MVVKFSAVLFVLIFNKINMIFLFQISTSRPEKMKGSSYLANYEAKRLHVAYHFRMQLTMRGYKDN